MIAKRLKTETGYNYILEYDSILNGIERSCLVTTNKGKLGRYAGVFVGGSWCEVSRTQAAWALKGARKIARIRKEAA
jgi:hypothetical protein